MGFQEAPALLGPPGPPNNLTFFKDLYQEIMIRKTETTKEGVYRVMLGKPKIIERKAFIGPR